MKTPTEQPTSPTELESSLKRADLARKWQLMFTVSFYCLAGIMTFFAVIVPDGYWFGYASIELLIFGTFTALLMTSWDSRIRYLILRRELTTLIPSRSPVPPLYNKVPSQMPSRNRHTFSITPALKSVMEGWR